MEILTPEDPMTREEAQAVIAELCPELERFNLRGQWTIDVIQSKLDIPQFTAIPGEEVEEIFDAYSEKIDIHHEQECHSWTRNFYNLIASQMLSVNSTDSSTFGDGHINWKDHDGTLRGVSSYAQSLYSSNPYQGSSDDDDYGIVVGTGSTAESFEDYQMDSLIAAGDGAGELNYSESPEPTFAWDSGARTFDIVHRRYMANNSGGSITIAEIGLKARVYYSSGQTNYALMARDVLGSSVAIADAGVARCKYTVVSATFPS